MGQLKYVLKRILLMFFTLFVIVAICFVMIRLLPQEMPQETNKQELIKARWEALGYNKPILVQFGIYLKNIFTAGDFGTSWHVSQMKPAMGLITGRLLPTVLVNLYSLLVSIPIGLAAGVLAAIKKNKWQDHVISTGVMLFVSIPSYVYAFLVQYIFYFKLEWFPQRVYSLADAGGSWFTGAMFKSMVLPIMALSFGTIAGLCRFTRAELTETLTSDYMLLARTKGLTEAQATIRHGIRNSLLPILTTLVSMFTTIMSGSLVIESIFGIPGMGGLMIKSINSIDYNVTQAVLIFYSVISLGTILLCDLLYGVVDPRVRIGGKKE